MPVQYYLVFSLRDKHSSLLAMAVKKSFIGLSLKQKKTVNEWQLKEESLVTHNDDTQHNDTQHTGQNSDTQPDII